MLKIIYAMQNYGNFFKLQRLASLYALLEHPLGGCLGVVMVKDARRCNAGWPAAWDQRPFKMQKGV